MPLVLDATAGSPSANSYATRSEALAYLESRLYAVTDWLVQTDGDKDAALVWATRLLDNHLTWAGARTYVNQALDWPRQGIVDKGGFSVLPYNVVPQEIKNAAAELAFQLTQSDPTAGGDAGNISRLKAGPVEITYKADAVVASLEPVPDNVSALIPKHWLVYTNTSMREVLRA
jgi:hypothetical protein